MKRHTGSAARCATIRAAAARPKPWTRRVSGPGARPTEFGPGPAHRPISSATGVRPGAASGGSARASGVNVGVSVDQSHTQIDVPLALQVATLDLTQIGANASVDKGPWTWAIALVHGFGNVNSSRDTGAGFARADYNAHIDGALTELSYYWSLDQSRIVPRSNMCAPPPHRFRSWAGLIPSRRAGQRWSVHGFCWVRRSVITGFSVKRFSICLATANSSTMSPRISVRSR